MCVDSQKLQLLTTSEIRTPITLSSLVNEKLGLKMEIPSADLSEETSMSGRPDELNSEWDHRHIVSILARTGKNLGLSFLRFLRLY